MIRKSFNQGWKVKKAGMSAYSIMSDKEDAFQEVNLPYDAMIHEKPEEKSLNGSQTGFFPGGQYIFVKRFMAPEQWKEDTVILEFEGIYQTAMIYVNNAFAASNLYGYSGFSVVLDPYLVYGKENELKVIADNTQEPNSRYYSGSGIYRNVNLLVGNKIHIPVDGLRIKTVYASTESAIVEIKTKLKNITREKKKVSVLTFIQKSNEVVKSDRVEITMFPEAEEIVRQCFCIQNPALWDCDSPELYDCSTVLKSGEEVLDECSEHFGIRTVTIDAEHGLRMNGRTVKLRGCCIHHDNGILGAATFARAEERRCRQLKEAGFNSIRSAHNPLSRAMLDACDRNGILVMDELSDMWTDHKNAHDFALYFEECWETEIERMIAKDYNHPCVLFYSTGNEIKELGTDTGARRNRRISNKFHEMDSTRFTTAGLNGMMALGACGKMGIVMKEILDKKKEATSFSSNQAGANALNAALSLMEGESAEKLARHPLLTEAMEESELSLDVIGLNYLTGRHVLEHELHPNKTIVGTETYPADIVRLWKLVKEYPHILGDYTWTGYDYLGEAGCGIFHYDGNANFSSVFPERAAYIGDIDLTGCRRPISYFREIVYGLRKKPYVAVERLNRYGMTPSKTAWMFKDNIASWTWPGYEKKPAVVDVYADAEEVELFLNGRSMGKKPAGEANGYAATYELCYEPGELKAVSYFADGETESFILVTAENAVRIRAEPDRKNLKADGEDLSFLTIVLTDDKGNENLYEERKISIYVEGAGSLQGFGSAAPSTVESYDNSCWSTYDGRAMAVIRAGSQPGNIKVILAAEGCEETVVELEVN